MRELKVIRAELDEMLSRLRVAKENYAEIVIEYMDMGYDSNHHVPKSYQKVVVDLMEEVNELHDEYHEVFYS